MEGKRYALVREEMKLIPSRRAMTLVSVPDANDNSYFVLKMSAKVDRWEEAKENFERAAETFRML